ncbi:NAD(P)-dependent oxidoreductase [Alteraurantiacibacter aquimixticola]|uniref:NAD(P)-dependent oxidoreductase n=1 Tax=Alteraurantiacibacter aquimixticola TaxID=2489173 RepID=A0A4T3EYT7_9SPHN|nr:NAD(P)-dependent oxidoreductase [Alteraurantiacibacter aquimixticola]TIX49029.1 NAD(P)-dependent oxidoreductase [Alteraurantiacibacter aquimixticola]
MTIIGFLGLGRMGAPMAANLLKAGHTLFVHDVSEDAVAELVRLGAEAAGSASALGTQCEVVFASLPTPAIVREAALGPDSIFVRGKPKVFCDLSTSGPQLAQELSAALTPQGVACFDAPVSGGIKGAVEGTISIMVGGPEAEYEAILRPLLEAIGKPTHMGEAPGAGQTMKLVNNLLGAVAIGVTAEGMAFGIKQGLDPAKMIDVLNQSTGINSATRDKWPRSVLPRTFDFGFAAALSLKDTRLLMDEAAAADVPLPLGQIVQDYLERTLEREGPEADFTAIAKVVEEAAGLDPER